MHEDDALNLASDLVEIGITADNKAALIARHMQAGRYGFLHALSTKIVDRLIEAIS
jgi:hypothetical protein